MVKFADYQLGQLRKIAFQYNEQLRIKDVSKSSKSELVKALEERLELSADGKKIRVKQLDIDNAEMAELTSAVVKEVLKERPKDIIFYKDGKVEEGTIEPISETLFNKGFKNIVKMRDTTLMQYGVIYFDKEPKGWVETTREYTFKSIAELLDNMGLDGITIENIGIENGYALYQVALKASVLNSGYWIRILLDAFAKTVIDNKLPTINVVVVNADTKLVQLKALVDAENKKWVEVRPQETLPVVSQLSEAEIKKQLKKPPTKKEKKVQAEKDAEPPSETRGAKKRPQGEALQVALPPSVGEDITPAPIKKMDLVLEYKLLPIYNPPADLDELETRARNTSRFYELGENERWWYEWKNDPDEEKQATTPEEQRFYDEAIVLARNFGGTEPTEKGAGRPANNPNRDGLGVKEMTLLIERIKSIEKELLKRTLPFEEERQTYLLSLPVLQSEVWVNFKKYVMLRDKKGGDAGIQASFTTSFSVERASKLIGLKMLAAGFLITDEFYQLYDDLRTFQVSFQSEDFAILKMETQRTYLEGLLKIVCGENPLNEIRYIENEKKYGGTYKEKTATMKSSYEDGTSYETLRPLRYLQRISHPFQKWEGGTSILETTAYRRPLEQLLRARNFKRGKLTERTLSPDDRDKKAEWEKLMAEMGSALKTEYAKMRKERATPAEAEAIKVKEAELAKKKDDEKKAKKEKKKGEKAEAEKEQERKSLQKQMADNVLSMRGIKGISKGGAEKERYSQLERENDIIETRLRDLSQMAKGTYRKL